MVTSGGADAGTIASSLALAHMKTGGVYWEIPATAHPPIAQRAVLLRPAKHPEAAKQFLDFIKGPDGQEVMGRYGFTLPD